MRKSLKTNSQGITLIALVITIIVLLILAAISIATLTGENGILTKASAAKLKSEKADMEEKIKLAVMTSRMGEDGTQINKKVLEDELKKYGFKDEEIEKSENGELPWLIKRNGFIFQITEDGKVKEVNGISLDSTILKILSGEDKTLTVTRIGDIEGNIIWSTSDETVATVENGKVTAVGTSGTVTITAKVEGTECEATCTVEIVAKVTNISIDNMVMKNDETKFIEVRTTPAENVEELTYKITTTNSDLITIDEENRTITAGSKSGTATVTITATASDGRTFTKEIKITVGDQKAKDVLTIDKTATEEAKKSPYVVYNNILCRVLYNNDSGSSLNDASQGLQIFADDSIREVTLGDTDSTVKASESTIRYNSPSPSNRNSFSNSAVLSMASYNNVKRALNGYAQEYLLADGPVSNARGIGCQSWKADPEETGANWYTATGANVSTKLDDFPATHSAYKIKKPYELTVGSVPDLSRIFELGLGYNKTESWIGSRCSNVQGARGEFGLASIPTTKSPTSAIFNKLLTVAYYNTSGIGDWWQIDGSNVTKGFRPVFLVKEDAKITGGDGTHDNPYTLGM